MNKDKGIKVIAFYLPQYHEIPENNKWWGKGFTEWTNVKKAKPLFEGHNQPRVPLNNNYYSLLEKETMINQSNLAHKYGVYGFCYYHYWFKNGKQLLEKPVDMMLSTPEINMPFCFSWANENWTRNWDGGNREVICEQDYGDEKDWEQHFLYLLPFFKDPRYILIDNKPMFIIYKPELVNKLKEMLQYFRKRCKEEGFDDLYIGYQFPAFDNAKKQKRDLFDFFVMFEPAYTSQEIGNKKISILQLLYKKFRVNIDPSVKKQLLKFRPSRQKNKKKKDSLTVNSYDEYWNDIINRKEERENAYPGAFVDWDNTPRNKTGMMFKGASPESFEYYFNELCKKTRDYYKKDMIFINAWNEWAEGAHLEPDEKNGYGYLEAINKSIKEGE